MGWIFAGYHARRSWQRFRMKRWAGQIEVMASRYPEDPDLQKSLREIADKLREVATGKQEDTP